MNKLITRYKTPLFTISFWLIASLVLLAERYQIAQHHLNVAYTRHVYLWLIGTLVSFAMLSVFSSELWKVAFNRSIWQILVSCLAAIITALLLNPMLYLMAGHDLQNVLVEVLSTGTLYFFLFYWLWSVLYLKWSSSPKSVVATKNLSQENTLKSPDNQVFNVDKMGEKRLLKDFDICYIKANGDYVELITENNSYIIKNTLKKIEKQLNNTYFKRVHRSTIVNCNKIKRVVAKQGGAFEMTLNGNHVILSSRSYKMVVEGLYPTA
ncbi:LytTR family DNA-binding domain-containing protein [Colwellia psychrerythraea]|uniref:Transcriptional regulator, LytTR family n=1 Tax=Colwellia psychrerythraea TaxID=28229 RepID=A0A099KTE0_COLPS|nr:LytTR family DNA-binding domain-containing protein [Colwellia psychrerythraea]KGJ93811.1 transcriptional regulator, LytTR family [Colwellia psychrerythraea]